MTARHELAERVSAALHAINVVVDPDGRDPVTEPTAIPWIAAAIGAVVEADPADVDDAVTIVKRVFEAWPAEREA